MKRAYGRTDDGRGGERGSILVMTTLAMATLLLFVGLSVDVAHVFMVRTQLQQAADAAALAAARELDSTAGGITQAAAKAAAMTNTYEYKKYSVGIASVTFSASKDGGYMSAGAATAAGVPQTIKFVRVTTGAAPVGILFASSVLGSTKNETATATAGMSIGLNNVCSYFPTAVAIDTPLANVPVHQVFTFRLTEFSPGTGLLSMTPGASYAVMNPSNGNSGGAGGFADIRAGLSSNDAACVRVGMPVYFSTSANNKTQIANSVNDRFDGTSADTNTTASNYTDYVASGTGNDRRVLLMPVVTSGSISSATASTTLTQFAGFFIKSRVNNNYNGAGASPDCAALSVEYLGNIVIPSGSYVPGGGSSSNLSIPVLY